jgi:hypothetical protein
VSYRPVCDTWILARPKVPYYGAYPNGFLERAVILLGVSPTDALLHVCGGHAKAYPAWNRLCPHGRTLDLDPATDPDFCQDARLPLPPILNGWPAILIDPPYTDADATHYAPGAAARPTARELLAHALDAVKVHGRIGILHYLWPRPPTAAKALACVSVVAGYNNRLRCFSVYERTL